MKKVLITATVQSHIAQFHRPLIKMLKKNGYEVHVAARNNLNEKNGLQIDGVDKIFDIPFSRSPIKFVNLKSYWDLKNIINEENYTIVHCNTPVGGVLTRLAARRKRTKGLKVIYTSHGFHFYKGSSILNWIIYYPIEKTLARYTDNIITISKEDYDMALKLKFKTKVSHIHGVGVNTNKYQGNKIEYITDSYRYYLNKDIILSVGELNKNKNQGTTIEAIKLLIGEHPDILLLIAGNGPYDNKLIEKVYDLGLNENVKFLGYRTDLEHYYNVSDIVVSMSHREGLGLNIIEAMLMGSNIIASNNRGHRELITNNENGYLVDSNDFLTLSKKISDLLNNKRLGVRFNEKSKIIVEKYKDYNVEKELQTIYESLYIDNKNRRYE